MTGGGRDTTIGLAAALSAFLWWGLSPLYFKAVQHVSVGEILAHRVLWTCVLMVPVTAAVGRLGEALALFARPRRLGVYAVTTLLVSGNWALFIYAILIERVLEISLGYFINPLVNVVFGIWFLGERLGRLQGVAVALAAAGVAVLVVWYGRFPWIAVTLAVSFALYTLVRKKAGIDPQVGLLVETALLLPVALAGIAWLGAAGLGHFAASWSDTGLLAAAGIVTGLPLVLVMHGAQRLALSTVGLLQYVAPSLQFLLAVLVFRETFTAAHAVTFALIWVGLALFSAEGWARYRRVARRST